MPKRKKETDTYQPGLREGVLVAGIGAATALFQWLGQREKRRQVQATRNQGKPERRRWLRWKRQPEPEPARWWMRWKRW